MGKYIIKAIQTEECNEDYAPDKEMTEGMECDAYLVLGMTGGKVRFESLMGISVDNLKDYLMGANKFDGASVIMQAAQIAEGYIRALEIFEQHKNTDALKELVSELINKVN